MTIKYLVTSGCSFSECLNFDRHGLSDNRTWPIHLREKISKVTHFSESMGGQGNGLIARRTYYRVNDLLKICQPEEILVGVMWTGRDRFDFYFEEPVEFNENLDGWMENPTRVVDDAPGGWVILNPHWTHMYNGAWYKNYYNEVASQIYTLEHIVNLQHYLNLKGVRYFFTSSFATHISESHRSNPNCSWLYDQIDWTKWLPIESEKHWVEENCPIPGANNFHPRSEQHGEFVDRAIIPWLKQQQILTST